MAETIFSKIIRREVPAEIVYEDDEVLAFRDIHPQAPVHVLVIPKEPLETVADAEASHTELLGKLLLGAAEVARRLGIEESGYRLVINHGRNAGQEVLHLHVHLLGGRPFSWPPG